jgi:RimJ/RimL family protein N-acetyltransferase/predicted N-acetyltransferase YhbS
MVAMAHLPSKRLTTARLELIPLQPGDADEMVAVLADEELYAFIGGRPLAVDELRTRFHQLAAGQSADLTEEWCNWIIRGRTDGRAVGTAQATIRPAAGSADVAWVIGRQWQGQGFASEAARSVVSWLEARGVNAITAHIHPEHHASAAVARNAGLVATGELEDGEQVWRRPKGATVTPTGARPRLLPTDQLTAAEHAAIRALMDVAFAPTPEDMFTDDDWQHALGGMHFVLDVDGQIVAHASVVERELRVHGRPLRTGYVEAVATLPERQGEGLGSRVMREVNSFIAAGYELGALGTGAIGFYERLGWRVWRGPLYVLRDGRSERTPDDEGGVLVLSTPTSPPLDLDGTLSCEWRPGDVW